MAYCGMNVWVDATRIASEMARDTELSYQILNELSYDLDIDKFAENIAKEIFEDENTDVIKLLEQIVSKYKSIRFEN